MSDSRNTGKIDPSRYAGHTPEPWVARPLPGGGVLLIRRKGEQPSVQIVPAADGHLMAEAPELLRRAQSLRARLDAALAERDRLRARLAGLRRRVEKLQAQNGGAAGALLWRHHVLELLEDDQP